MQNEHLTSKDSVSPPLGKKTYSAPALEVFGTVAEFTRGANTNGTDNSPYTNSRKNHASDPALKQNAVRIGEHFLGFGIYLFEYKPEFCDAFGHGRQFGVMADEVSKILPEAVSRNSNGYMTVDYGRLGIERH